MGVIVQKFVLQKDEDIGIISQLNNFHCDLCKYICEMNGSWKFVFKPKTTHMPIIISFCVWFTDFWIALIFAVSPFI